MYKLLLCWRYLRTRYIALVCIISVTLGVATMIVVNSVMAGFSAQMITELNSMLGDLVLQTRSLGGVADAKAHMERIRRAAGDRVVGMSPTLAVPALVYMPRHDGMSSHPVMLVGIDEATYASVSTLGKFLQHPKNRAALSFQLHENGYDLVDHLAKDPKSAKPRDGFDFAGGVYRRWVAAERRRLEEIYRTERPSSEADVAVSDPFKRATSPKNNGAENADLPQLPGIILAMNDISYKSSDDVVHLLNRPGDDVRVSYPSSSAPFEALSHAYTVVDTYQAPMQVDSSSMAFVPLAYLQRARGMVDPTTGVGKFTSIQIKLAPGADLEGVRRALEREFGYELFGVTTWKDSQAQLLHAIQTETTVLNILLFFIVAVAGFGILAIFYMIVVEKTRDIGILKSLGASGRGVMGIFLIYGLSLGVVGAGAGTAIGVAFAWNINEVASLVERVQGAPVFDPSVYFFDKIPTTIDPWTIGWIVCGAVGIAVLASVLPARRAARLHPVRALRFE